ncbi:peptide transporter family 1 isoform X2 [Andrena cerasifolii]|uniref:peptide transporter family 1 isoform X2 n=1 Tax=Andrena cerasifolii TaxID=2819439 RepID=UPI004037FAAD
MNEPKDSMDAIQDHSDNGSNVEENQKKLKYPKSVFFIISNEFCERFSFYGMRTVLTLYLVNQLNYESHSATSIYHAFMMLAYFFPLFGAVLADSMLGKFRTILYLSIVYAIGQFLLSLSAAPPVGLPSREFSLVGLLLIAFGTGGIKPCVSAFGGDQFVLPQQERYMSTFFSLFYFSINFGSLISTFLTPVLRSDVTCFGLNSCYSLAFLVPAILMTLSIVIFALGKPLYRIRQPTGNIMLVVSKCICHAISKKSKSKGEKREHWLDYADDEYDQPLISDIKAALQVIKLFIPIPIFWALYDQQGSRWTLQAAQMDGEMGSFLLQPDQMLVVNPLLVMAFIPLFETCIYPVLSKVGISTPLRKLSLGGLLAALSFVISAFVDLQLEGTQPILPSAGLTQVRIFNTLNCPVPMTIGNATTELQNLDMWVNQHIEVKGTQTLSYKADFTGCKTAGYYNPTLNSVVYGNMALEEAAAISYVITPNGLTYHYKDSVSKSRDGLPRVRGLFSVDPPGSSVTVELIRAGIPLTFNWTTTDPQVSELNDVKHDTYDIVVNGEKVKSDVPLKSGGVYTVVGSVTASGKHVNVVVVTQSNSLHILWMLPQYIVITVGEVMFSVTGLEFAFTQSPDSMKSLMQAAWQLTVAIGNLIVIIISEGAWFDRQAYEFFLFAGLMFLDIIIFSIMAKFYKYVDVPEDDDLTEEISMTDKRGTENKSYKDDEK